MSDIYEGGPPEADEPSAPSESSKVREALDEPVARKEYYSIGEVCDLTGLRSHVLRYWETQFEVLRPTKNRAGNRVFRHKDIEVILLVKRLLYDEKYTIEGAKQKLEEMRDSGELTVERPAMLDSEFLTGMKSDLKEILDLLSVPAPARPR